MKRPDGFDRRPAPVSPPAPRGRARGRAAGSAPSVQSTRGATPAPPAASAPSRPAKPTTAAPAASEESEASKRTGPDQHSATSGLRDAQRERRRYERGEIRRFTKRSRRRKILWLSSFGDAVVLIAGVVLVAFSPMMALQSITVEGANRISATQVESALKGQLGKPLPLVDLGAIHTDLSRFTLIRSYSTETIPPSQLIVRIVEREAVGVVQVGHTYDLVDPAHVTISSGEKRPEGYPLIEVPGSQTGKSYAKGFAAAVAVLRALPAAVLTQVDVVNAQTQDDVTLTLGKGRPTVVWGSASQSNLKAAALERLMAEPGAKDVTEYDVSSPYSVVTR